MGLQLTTEPATEPITTAQAKAHARIDISDDDALVDLYITAARKFFEHQTRRALITQSWTYTLERFPPGQTPIIIPIPPVISITSIKYYDTDGVQQTWNSALYDLDSTSEPARVRPAWNETYPVTRAQMNAVEIIFACGYGDASDVPELYKTAIKEIVHLYYERRLPVAQARLMTIPLSCQAIIDQAEVGTLEALMEQK